MPMERHWTDTPRALTPEEMVKMREAIRDGFLVSGRLRGVKEYRTMTDATLGVAVRFVDALRAKEGLGR